MSELAHDGFPVIHDLLRERLSQGSSPTLDVWAAEADSGLASLEGESHRAHALGLEVKSAMRLAEELVEKLAACATPGPADR